ncbi:hypothetical protein [Micromonospora sp. NPDC051296]|uniref:hypothetical protein n=1 Tax=Micromonospora sp. NPDC051296 TaxID=3155046 RepID=UPI00343A572A
MEPMVPKNTTSRRTPAKPFSASGSSRSSSRRVPRQAEPVDDERTSNERYLLTQRDLLILMITLIVGLLAAIVTGLTTAIQAGPTLGIGPSVALGVAGGIVTLVLTGLVVANRLHKLVR